MEKNIYVTLKEIALREFPSVVEDAVIFFGPLGAPKRLRIFLSESSFIDIRISGEKYSYHWERRVIKGTIYRHDNAPHYKEIKTFPKHFHEGREENVKESHLSDNYEKAIRELLTFVKEKLELEKRENKYPTEGRD